MRHHLTEKLLENVMRSIPFLVRKLIGKGATLAPDYCIITMKSAGVEAERREWKSVSPLEFAAWSGDIEIIDLLLKAIPSEYKPIALKQLSEVKTKGLEHGKFLAPIYALIEAHTTFEAKYKTKNVNERRAYCINTIGNLQIKLTNFGLDWLCDNNPAVEKYKRPPSRVIAAGGESLLPLSRSEIGKTCFLERFALPGSLFRSCWKTTISAGYFSESSRRRLEKICKASTEYLDQQILKLENEIEADKTKSLRV